MDKVLLDYAGCTTSLRVYSRFVRLLAGSCDRVWTIQALVETINYYFIAFEPVPKTA